jgi:hypothetical protein
VRALKGKEIKIETAEMKFRAVKRCIRDDINKDFLVELVMSSFISDRLRFI